MDDVPAVAGYQDAICALRLAVWTLERSAAHERLDAVKVAELIARRADELRRLLEMERALAV